MNVLLIEDEAAAALALARLLGECRPEARVLATLDSIAASETWLNAPAHPVPDLIFLDIHLADGSSFELFRRCAITAPVVFVTAYDQHALAAFRANGIDYLLKPLLKADLQRSLAKVDTLRAHYTAGAALPLDQLLRTVQQLAAPAYKTSWLVQHRDKLVPVAGPDVAYFTIRHGVVFLTTCAGQEYALEQTLDELEAAVNPQHFFRGTRQVLFARRSVTELTSYFNGRLLVRLAPLAREEVVISKARAGELKAWLGAG